MFRDGDVLASRLEGTTVRSAFNNIHHQVWGSFWAQDAGTAWRNWQWATDQQKGTNLWLQSPGRMQTWLTKLYRGQGIRAWRTGERGHHGFASLHRVGIEAGIMTLLINPRKGRINGKSKIITKGSPRCIHVCVCVCVFTKEKRIVIIHVKRH